MTEIEEKPSPANFNCRICREPCETGDEVLAVFHLVDEIYNDGTPHPEYIRRKEFNPPYVHLRCVK